MSTVTSQQQKWLLRKFHTLCTRLGLDADMKLALIGGYGVESSKDLSNAELTEVCEKLNGLLRPEEAKREKMRKRVIASVGGWLRQIGKGEMGIDYIKGVACRAAGTEHFNSISYERLTTLYNMFIKKQRDAERVNRVCGEIGYETRFGRDNLLN